MTVKQLGARVRYWSRILRLRHWDFDVEIVEGFADSPESYARCHCEDSYDQALLSFKQEWLDEAEYEEIEIAVVHELLHVYMRNFDHTVERIEDQLAPTTAAIWHEQVKHDRENTVDRLSRLIVQLHDE